MLFLLSILPIFVEDSSRVLEVHHSVHILLLQLPLDVDQFFPLLPDFLGQHLIYVDLVVSIMHKRLTLQEPRRALVRIILLVWCRLKATLIGLGLGGGKF